MSARPSPVLRTVSYVAVAGLLAAAAVFTRPRPPTVDLLAEIGTPLVPAFTDPRAVTDLTVVQYNTAAAAPRAFAIRFDGTRWIIPSHFNYPADAAEKVGAAASAFAGLLKEQIVTDSPEDHAALGVVAPDSDAPSPDGRGTRVTFKDSTGKTLLDLVLGANLPDSTTKRYVRPLDSSRVYVCTVDGGFSTKLADWVQTDLLELPASKLSSVTLDRYRVDEKTSRVEQTELLTLTRIPGAPDDPSNLPWTLDARSGTPLSDAPLAPGESFDSDRLLKLTSALSGLRIVGVGPKPENLVKLLSSPDATGSLALPDQLSLQSRGFYLTPDGRLVANDGQMTLTTDDGILYSVWFGEVAAGSAEDASLGRVGSDDAPSTAPPSDAQGQWRYLMVTAQLDPSWAAREPKKPDPVDPPTPESQAAAAQYEQALKDFTAKRDAAKARAEKLSRRFADWYYVIDNASFSDLRPTRAELVKPPPAQPAPALAPDVPESPAQSPSPTESQAELPAQPSTDPQTQPPEDAAPDPE